MRQQVFDARSWVAMDARQQVAQVGPGIDFVELGRRTYSPPGIAPSRQAGEVRMSGGAKRGKVARWIRNPRPTSPATPPRVRIVVASIEPRTWGWR